MSLQILGLLVTSYLFVGCVVMLAFDSICPGMVDRGRFVLGMILWPVLLLSAAWHFLGHYWRRAVSRG